jgi:DNA-binding transcriptional ArsR family regulator
VSEAAVFRALADPTRRQILQYLKGRELAAGEIVERLPISGPSVSRHLAILKSAGLVHERRNGNRILYRLDADRLAFTVSDFISAVCPAQIDLRRRARRRGAS